METIHADDSPLAAYLEGDGTFEPDVSDNDQLPREPHTPDLDGDISPTHSFAPRSKFPSLPRISIPPLKSKVAEPPLQTTLTRAYLAWSSAVNSRLGAADNTKFLEHFRYPIVASQLLNEYLDHGSLVPSTSPTVASSQLDGASDEVVRGIGKANLIGACSAAALAFALVILIDWVRSRRIDKSKAALVITALGVAAFVGYGYLRRQWLQDLRQQAVGAATCLTTNWQSLELSSSSTLSFIQEVELVSKGYRLSTPLPPASRIEGGTTRRCAKLRTALHKAYASAIPECIQACTSLRALVDEDDLERYYEVYDISLQDAIEVSGPDALTVLEDDPESLKSLRVLSYRAGLLRRVTLCSLMALEADGGKVDFYRWQIATDVMRKLSNTMAVNTEKIRRLLAEMESFNSLASPTRAVNTPVREKMRGQVRKLSALGTGIRGLQAKMQILREETNNSIEKTEDLTDLGPTLMAQYDSIGADLRDLLEAWQAGKESLQSNITRQEYRLSLASSGLRSPVSSLGGLTAVEEIEGSPADALKFLNGDNNGTKSNRWSANTSTTQSSSEEMVFEAVALPKTRPNSTLTREERIVKMHEDRARQAEQRAKRESNTSMLRELESVINLRPRKSIANGSANSPRDAAAARVASL